MLTWEELRTAFREMQEWDATGILRDGILRSFTAQIFPPDDDWTPTVTWLTLARQVILMEIANRSFAHLEK